MALPVASWVDQRNVGSAIDERFDQPNFKAHKNLESVLVNCACVLGDIAPLMTTIFLLKLS